MITLQATLSSPSTKSHMGQPMIVDYTPPHKWHTFSSLYNRKTDKHELKAHGITHDVGVYEVRLVNWENEYERLYVGSGILYSRIGYLLRKNEKAHTHANDIWGRAEEYLREHPEKGKDKRDVLEIAWTLRHEPELLELTLHVLYHPLYPDERLFLHGYGPKM